MKKLNNAVDRFCILHPNFGIPNLMLYIVIANVAVYLLNGFSNNALTLALYFSPRLVLRGQIWRLLTFAAVPGGTGLLFLLYCYFTYSMGRTLEQQWGTAKFTCYYLGGMILTVLGVTVTSLLLGVDYPVASTSDITFAMFLAFAVLFPDATFVLFPLPIPIRAKYVAYFDLALFAYEIASPILSGYWYAAVVPLMALVNVFIMIWPEMADFLHIERSRARQTTHFRNVTANARRQQTAQQASSGLRVCAVCGRSNQTNPELEFRYCSRCAGYRCFCSDHLFSHVHFTEDQP
ncbi:MAG: rhomboid family intramembrane serine protease [Oscillospiraceae bacterium]|nr:rhomboid family intramembrane serine protease [Oscillospiraceae bacterium]